MRALVQRVSQAAVSVDGEIVGQIGRGVVVLVGVTHGDTEEQAEWLARKVAGLRIFEDSPGKMNAGLLGPPPLLHRRRAARGGRAAGGPLCPGAAEPRRARRDRRLWRVYAGRDPQRRTGDDSVGAVRFLCNGDN